MPMDNLPGGADLPDITDPSRVLDDLEPETIDGPLGIPILKPKGAPEPPNPGSGQQGLFNR